MHVPLCGRRDALADGQLHFDSLGALEHVEQRTRLQSLVNQIAYDLGSGRAYDVDLEPEFLVAWRNIIDSKIRSAVTIDLKVNGNGLDWDTETTGRHLQ